MTGRNADLVRRCRAVFWAGDLDAWLEFFDDDVDYVPVRLWPDARPRKGKAALRHFIEAVLADWGEDGWSQEDRELIESGDRVLVRTRATLRGAQSGIELSGRLFHVYTIRDGKIVKLEDIIEADEAYRAAGIDRPESG